MAKLSMQDLDDLEHNDADMIEARAVLEMIKPQMYLPTGQITAPILVPSYQLMLDYVRLRLMMVALKLGDHEAAVSLSVSSGTMPPITMPAQPANGAGLILPGR